VNPYRFKRRAVVFGLVVVTLLTLSSAGTSAARLVYQRYPHGSVPGGIVVARNDGSGAHLIARGQSPYISPSGHKVAYFSGTSLYVIGVGGRHRRRVVKVRAYDPGPEVLLGWSADDRYIVVDRGAAVGGDAFFVDLKRRTVRRFGEGDDFAGASFAPKGSRFAFGDADSTDRHSGGLFVYHGHPYRRRFVAEGQGPVWGKLGLAFDDDPPYGDIPRPPLVRVMANDGRVRTVFTEDTAGPLFPVAWSGGGRELLIAEFRRGAPRARPFGALLLRPRTGHLVRVPATFTNVWGLSRDGSEVLGERDGNVVSATVDGTVTVLARHAVHPRWTK